MLSREQRLRKTGDFKAVYTRGRSYVHPTMVVYVLKREGDGARIGFSVSKKLGGAAARNRIKRRLGEAGRELVPRVQVGTDVIIVARSSVAESSVAEMRAILELQLRRAGVLEEREIG